MTEGAERVGAALQLVLTVALVAFLFWGAFRKRRRGKPVKDGPEDEPYKVFTKGCDQELEARLVPEMLRSISPDFAKGYLQISRDAWNIRIQRARDMLANAPAIDMKIGLPSQLATALKASCVVLLVDQSGSMKGDPILDTAVAVRRVADGLSAAGATFEVLGFSTLGWQGGFARQKWLGAGKPKRPGRLCALLHIVYKSMDEVALNDADWQAMLDPNILRENVDGEAIEWAEARLKAYPEGKRILIVISDGAPVDDSTLMENGEAYLIRHLRAVIARVEAENVLRLGAIGLNFAVEEYYSMSRFAGPDQDIAAETIKLITALLGDNPK